MKVPIDYENDDVRDDENNENNEPEATEPETADDEIAVEAEVIEDEPADEADEAVEPELDPEEEAARVEAAIRAGEQAAEEDFKAEVKRAEEQRDELIKQVVELETEAAAAHAEATAAQDKYARLQADWDNYRRRTARERLQERERAAEKLVTNLLPVIDDMERAVGHASSTGEGNEALISFAEGVEAIRAKMVGILERDGVEVIDPAGEPFDPIEHQAVGRAEDPDAYDETVAQVYQKGYRMGGKVIRPAMVTVTFGGPRRPQPADAGDEDASE